MDDPIDAIQNIKINYKHAEETLIGGAEEEKEG